MYFFRIERAQFEGVVCYLKSNIRFKISKKDGGINLLKTSFQFDVPLPNCVTDWDSNAHSFSSGQSILPSNPLKVVNCNTRTQVKTELLLCFILCKS